MLFAPFAGEGVCRRLPDPTGLPGTPNMEPRHALDAAAWLWHPDLAEHEPGFVLFRLSLKVARAETVRLQVSADLAYALALDGALIARGPDSGDVPHWACATYALKLRPGSHRLEALVWWAAPPQAPEGRQSWRGGFACAGLGRAAARLTTGLAPWRVAWLRGVEWGPGLGGTYHVIGGSTRIDLSRFDARQAVWVKPAHVREPIAFNLTGILARGWRLEPAVLPEQRHELWRGGRVRARLPRWTSAPEVKFGAETETTVVAGWNDLLQRGRALTLPAGYRETVLIDTDDYLCGYPLLEFSDGAGTRVRIDWAESLFLRVSATTPAHGPGAKGHRDEVAGKRFMGFGDTWILAGRGRRWICPPWWRSGRYLLVSIEVGSTPVVLHTLAVERTGFPLEIRAHFASDEASLTPVIALCERGLQACMHDVFVDCPYYEQMMYVADTRIQMLLSYVTAGDDRLARRGMELFDRSRNREGYPAMRHPSCARQESATFAMIWPWMLRDFALWRDDPAWLRQRLPGLRALMEALRTETDNDGLLVHPPGWLFVDWVSDWQTGWAPGQRAGRLSALVNLHYLISLQSAAEVEAYVGETGLAERHVAAASRAATAIKRLFWDERRGLWADDSGQATFSQHAQALAVMGGLPPPDPSRWADAAVNGIAAASIYFQHYVFEALGRLGRGDLVLEKLATWRALVEQGFKTPFEQPEPARSDCHAWGAHPLFHLHATIAGVRPAAPGFRRVRIAPQPGSLTRIETQVPQPHGVITLKAQFDGSAVEAVVTLPPGVEGEFFWRGQTQTLRAGAQTVHLG